MDLEKLFKNLIVSQGMLLVIAIIAELNMPAEYYELNLAIQSDLAANEVYMFLNLIILTSICEAIL